MIYYVWQREDGYVGATNGYFPREPGFQSLGEFTEWPDALHFILTEQGHTTPEAHRERNCTRCWEITDTRRSNDALANIYDDANGHMYD